MKMYPGHFVPPIPRKKKVRSLDKIYLNKRKKVLETFLDYLLKIPFLSNCVYVSDFLSISEESIFKQKKKEADLKSPPIRLADF